MVINSFINKLKPVSIYRNPNITLKERFEKSENKGKKWRKDFETWQNEKEPMRFLHFYTKGYAFTKIESWRELLHGLVNIFSLSDVSDNDFDDLTDYVLKSQKYFIRDIKRENRDVLLVTLRKGNKTLQFQTITSLYPDIDKFMPDLKTPKRERKCHKLSRNLAIQHHLENINAEVVTGVVNRLSPKFKYLHSWVEIEVDGEKIALDPTENIILAKEDYDKYYCVQELERISGKTLYDEKVIFLDLITKDCAYSKLYLCSHAEALQAWKDLGFDKMTSEQRLEYYENAERERKLKEEKEKNKDAEVQEK